MRSSTLELSLREARRIDEVDELMSVSTFTIAHARLARELVAEIDVRDRIGGHASLRDFVRADQRRVTRGLAVQRAHFIAMIVDVVAIRDHPAGRDVRFAIMKPR